MAGLHVPTKAERVARFQAETVHTAIEITGAEPWPALPALPLVLRLQQQPASINLQTFFSLQGPLATSLLRKSQAATLFAGRPNTGSEISKSFIHGRL